jgi:hypothetical protein
LGWSTAKARTNKKKGSKNKIRLVLFEFHMKKKMPPKGRVLACTMKFSMENLRKKLTLFPSSFHMSNEGGKKTLTSSPLPFNSKKREEKNQGAPAPLKE